MAVAAKRAALVAEKGPTRDRSFVGAFGPASSRARVCENERTCDRMHDRHDGLLTVRQIVLANMFPYGGSIDAIRVFFCASAARSGLFSGSLSKSYSSPVHRSTAGALGTQLPSTGAGYRSM